VIRALKVFLGLALWPMAIALARSAAHVIADVARCSDGRSSGLGLAAGFALWVFCYFTMPRPMWSYVLGHELTHALWSFFSGGTARGLRVTDRGGQVRVSRDNVWVSLSPYFFPFYTMVVLLAYGALILAGRDVVAYRPFWMAMIGLTWGFHLTFTVSLLSIRQPDIREHGRIFSYALILALNAAWIGFGVALIAGRGAGAWAGRLSTDILWAYGGLARVVAWGTDRLRETGWFG